MRTLRIDLKWAQTLDGQLCDDSGRSQWISGPEERRMTHGIRAEYDAIAVGASTYLADRAQLTVREGFERQLSCQPHRIVFDPRGSLARALGELSGAELDSWISDLGNSTRPTYIVGEVRGLAEWASHSIRLVGADLRFENPNFAGAVATALREIPTVRKANDFRLLVEGGPRLLTKFISAGLYEELQISIAPKITGGSRYRIDLGRLLPDALELEIVRRESVGADTFLALRRPGA